MITYLIDTCDFLSKLLSQNGWSPLLYACSSGHSEIIRVLLNQNARVDVFDEVSVRYTQTFYEFNTKVPDERVTLTISVLCLCMSFREKLILFGTLYEAL